MLDSRLQQKRLVAAAVDIAILIALGLVSFIVNLVVSCSGLLTGALADGLGSALSLFFSTVGLAFVLGRDVVVKGRSPGKHVQDIRVVTATGQPITIVHSVKRNVVFAAPFALGMLTSVIGLLPYASWLNCLFVAFAGLMTVAALGIVGFEGFNIVHDPNGIRLGDRLARTKVAK